MYLAPLLVLAHVVEEAPRLVAWLNRHVEPDLTMRYFFGINSIGVLVTVVLAFATIRSRDRSSALWLIGWLGFVMLANGVLHLVAVLVFREYVPGAVTAGALYLPYFFAATVTLCRRFEVRPFAAVLAAAIGAVPMVVQGIGILAFGRRALW